MNVFTFCGCDLEYGMLRIHSNVPIKQVKWHFALVHLRKPSVFSRFAAEHINHDEQVATLSRDTLPSLKFKKCNFVTKSIHYLNHIICGGCLETSSPTTDAIEELEHHEM